jgi:glycosyltransferase involved in cell wall biosynthesis
MRSPNLHVLHVITGIDRGGAENHLFDLVRHQCESGMAVTVAYLRGNGYWAAPLRALGAEVQPLGLQFYGELKPLVRLGWLLRSTEFDLVHAHLPPAELYVRLALLGINRKTLPLLITKHNEERFCDAPGKHVLGRWVARRADRIIAISDAVKRYMCGSGLGVEERKLQTIHYGIDAARLDHSPGAQAASLRSHWSIADNELAIGFVGRLAPQKDIGTLVRGFALYAARFAQAKLVIVGSGPLDEELRRLAEDLRIVGRIVWAGFRDDIATVMSAFDIFALTSIYEGLGLVLLEAMASALPVVATRAGAIPEVVTDGETGVLVAPRRPNELAAAFHDLSDSRRRAQFGAAGRARVMCEFTLEKMCRETDALYGRYIRRRSIKTEAQIGCAVSTVN